MPPDDDPRLGGTPDWEWIEAEVRPAGEWAQMAELAHTLDLEELGAIAIAALLRAQLSEAKLRALLEQRNEGDLS